MLHKTKDDALINSAYLSELWAVTDLQRIKAAFPETWTPERERQLLDEVRHASMLLQALRARKAAVVTDLKYSMQEKLYAPLVNLGSTQNISEASLVHNMTERRAVWIYRTYQKVGTDADYKKITRAIYLDEKSHFDLNDDQIIEKDRDSDFSKKIIDVDRELFRKTLPAKYGNIVFASENFWTDYYAGAVV